jgi:hypothetical protein
MGFAEIEEDRLAFAFDQFLFIENGLGNNVFLARPIAQVAIPAALAAKRKIRVHRGVGLSLANRAFVFHGKDFFSAISEFSVPSASKKAHKLSAYRSQRPLKMNLRNESIA